MKKTIFSTNYTLSLLLPLMMWGAMRYGYKLISLLWAVVLMISIHSYQITFPFIWLYHAADHNLLQLSGILFLLSIIWLYWQPVSEL